MGSFFACHAVNCNSQAAVIETLKAHGAAGQRYVSPVIGGWISIHDENCESLDVDDIVTLGSCLAKVTSSRCIAFRVCDSDDLDCFLFDRHGKHIAVLPLRLISTGSVTDAISPDPSAIGREFPEVTTEAWQTRLAEDDVFAEDLLSDLAKIMGIENMQWSYTDLSEELSYLPDDIVGAASFVHLGD